MTLAEAQQERRRLIGIVQALVQKADPKSPVLAALDYLSTPDTRDGRELVSSVSAGIVGHYALDRSLWGTALDAWAVVLKFTHDVRRDLSL